AAQLTVTYNHRPSRASIATLDPADTSGTGPAHYYSRTATPLLSSTLSDADGDSVRGLIRVFTGPTLVWETYSPYVSSGSTVTVSVPPGKLAEGAYFRVFILAEDS